MGYAAALLIGAASGGYLAGTANLWLSGIDQFGRSTAGALAGAICAVECYKARCGIRGSTGAIFTTGFAVSITIGRFGCFFAGLEDHTFGTPTALPWGHDFGDGVLRHPVQLYEAGAMALFLLLTLILLAKRNQFFIANGFYLLAGWYGGQRFAWEFLKPYATLFGQFNLFHFICGGLVVYAVVMILRTTHDCAKP